mgnify:CR=1 FL=1
MDNIEQLRKVATRAGKLLTSLSESIRQQKEELKLTEFYQEYSKAALYKLPKLSKGSVEYAVAEMEAGGYIFKKKPSGNTMKYAMTIQNVIDDLPSLGSDWNKDLQKMYEAPEMALEKPMMIK